MTAAAEPVTLRDGSRVLIRPIAPGDKPKLALGLERLSEESRYRRFLTPVDHLSDSVLRYLTEVDHHDHEALVAESAAGRDPVGVARYVRLADDPAAAEVAVAVVDDWQNRGVATELMQRLAARAAEEGVSRFTATCLAENREVLELIEDLGGTRLAVPEDGLVELVLPVAATTAAEPLRAALRHAASGALAFLHRVQGGAEPAGTAAGPDQ